MATLIDALMQGPLIHVLIFLLVFALVYAILNKFKVIENTSINAVISFIVALFVASTDKGIVLLYTVLPWYTVFFIIGFFFLLFMSIAGVDVTKAGGQQAFVYTALTIMVIILLFGLTKTFSSDVRPKLPGGGNYTEGIPSTWQEDFARTFFHPKFLGLLVFFIVAILTIAFLGASYEK